MFKPFGRQYCMIHPSYCQTEHTLPSSDCPTLSVAPPSVRTLREDSGGDHPKVGAQLKMPSMNLKLNRPHCSTTYVDTAFCY